MTAAEIAKLLHGKRAGKGFMCKCPVHRDRSPSLSVRPGKKCVSIHCFRGCETVDILAALGLGLKDLYPGTKRDFEAERLAERMRREVEWQKWQAKLEAERQADLARKWAAVRNALGFLLIQQPESDKLASLFNHACNMSRDAIRPWWISFEFESDSLRIKHWSPILDGVTAQDVGAQIAKILRLK